MMKTYSVARCMSALTLIVSMFVAGMQVPAGAAGEEVVAGARHSGLTLNGRPLSELVGATATVRGRVPSPSLLEQESGHIGGVALDAQGQPLADHSVELLGVSEQGAATSVVAAMTTNANGGFSFPGLGQGRYLVDVRADGRLVATSGPIVLAAGGMTFTQVGSITQPSSSADGHGKGGLFWMAVGASVGVGAGLILTASSADCDRSDDSLITCPVGTALLGTFGGILGLLLGAGR